MIDLLLHDLLPPEQFGITWDLIDKMETAGTTHSQELAQNKYYKKSVSAWVKAKEAHQKRLMASRTF